jgi:hypothetical protein
LRRKSTWRDGAAYNPASNFTGANGGNRENNFAADHADKRGSDAAESATISAIRGKICRSVSVW